MKDLLIGFILGVVTTILLFVLFCPEYQRRMLIIDLNKSPRIELRNKTVENSDTVIPKVLDLENNL